MKTKFINLTPHEVAIHLTKEEIKRIPPSGIVARCQEKSLNVGTLEGVPIVKKVFGEVTDLPEPAENTYYITSSLVAQAAKRADVLSPGDPVRDEKGQIIGCRTLCSYV